MESPDLVFWSGGGKSNQSASIVFNLTLYHRLGIKKENTKRCLYSLPVCVCCLDDELFGEESVIGLMHVWRANSLLVVIQQPLSRL